ncbi:MAG: hypothetical protein PHS74_05120 [Lachnospiraceae bacterium]|nr:hypothetical protein [Lachnospiraceae bacterium]
MFLTAIVVLLLLSILLQIISGVLYQKLILETENMQTTENKLLKTCKLKFANCYQLNLGVTNIPVFVDKFLNKISMGHIKLVFISQISGQCMLLAVLLGGIGACQGIIRGDSISMLLPYYIISLLGLYVYFSIATFIDIPNKQKVIKTNVIDYLENHMINKLKTVETEKETQKELEKEFQQEFQNKKQKEKISFFTKSEEQELEELLKEFLT